MHRPLIGVTPGQVSGDETSITLYNGTLDALWAAGGDPCVLPMTDDPERLELMLDTMDGVLFTGGGDVAPLLYGAYQHPALGNITPKRDAMELPLARMAYARKDVAVFGICRGCQVLNIALGGTVWQDIPSEYPGHPILHRQKDPGYRVSHPVRLDEGSRLRQILGTEEILVNSLHHQAVDRPGEGLTVTAHAPDGVSESVEAQDHPFYIGVQWHPERLWQEHESAMELFRAFVRAAERCHRS